MEIISEQEKHYVAGIDEAGRGPAVGPLVYALAAIPIDELQILNDDKDLKDSKKMTLQKREELREKYANHNSIKYHIEVTCPELLSVLMNHPNRINLNEISISVICSMIKLMTEKYKINHIFIDTVGEPNKLRKRLEDKFPGIHFTVEKKADDKYKIVSAASVFAKTERDRIIDGYKKDLGINVGSGYPADPNTKKYLKEAIKNFNGYGDKARFSWSTICKLIENNCEHINIGNRIIEEESSDSKVQFESVYDYLGFKPL